MNIRKWQERYSIDCDIKYQSKATRNTYKMCVKNFLKHFKDQPEPKAIPNQLIKQWLLSFKTLNTRKQMQCAVNSFYKLTVKMPSKISKIPYPKKQKRLPQVIDTQYLVQAINQIKNLKHKAILMLAFSCGLRVSEVVNLKMSAIDRSRMLIHIQNAKGNKDRYVVLSQKLLEVLEAYYKAFKPITYLFNGQTNLQYTATSCNQIVKQYLGPQYHFHTLRHSNATALLEAGTDITLIQKLLGHQNVKTTQIYTHVSLKTLSNVQPPM